MSCAVSIGVLRAFLLPCNVNVLFWRTVRFLHCPELSAVFSTGFQFVFYTTIKYAVQQQNPHLL